MKKKFIMFGLAMWLHSAYAQETISPAGPQQKPVFLTNAVIHVGNGQVIEKGTITFDKGKITAVGTSVAAAPADATVVDLKGQHVYPGIIVPDSDLGLIEFESVRATIDVREVGEINPSVRSLIAYNTDSKVINTLRSNGILLAQVTPKGGIISGTSSVVQLDAWNWEDAAYKVDNGLHFFIPRQNTGGRRGPNGGDAPKTALDQVEGVRAFFREAKAYLQEAKHTATNLKFEAMRPLFKKEQKLFVHCDLVKEMLVAIDFAKEFDLDVTIVGGADSWQIADLLKQSNISVILTQPHSLPIMQDDDVDQPYKTAAQLQKAGVLFCLSNEGFWQQRNLGFEAGTAAAYGLTKEEALSAVTINAAKILGIDKMTGTLEVGKDANIAVSTGDMLDMKSSVITQAFIQGREINLDNKQKQLSEKYIKKYGLQ
ncbi:imidazolonepropionase-like amidohydrolase [Chitinophaga terrae (ex Kim and Jung 2007)]|uniref:amidohydrolase family protein n=1 Tax=Chitinophaga terrae (ex Kim and Jung 2007) TaxID=408074 RepID=UPI0027894B29|nr:amidohydrolase family protein [Chitinophaga terrae (ex Kim and Jung 2007)]MDQ0105863.1 imidazolonepropionase-like amidohydrolase [Chitinophaga terrae (ex Kim and Jung 2007)]